MPHPTRPSPRTAATLRRAFTLIEMLVVLLILTVVISIVVPALKHFRDAARKSATVQLMSSLSTAVSQFKMSQNRLPGYFSPRDMGSAMNNSNAFSGMENLMLDLAGGVTTDPTVSGSDPCDPAQFSVIAVGPTDTKVNVDIPRIGAAEGAPKGQVSRGYFKPDPKYFVRQCKIDQRDGVTGSNDARLAMPVIVDAWGQPILAWVQDDVPPGAPLVNADSSTRARFYLSSNACFAKAKTLGKLAQNQTDPTTGSLLFGANSDNSVAGIVGNPAFANQARGPIVFHSAGSNGIYIGRSERGGKQFNGPGGGTLPASVGRDYFQEGDFDDFVQKAE
jgi:prepilin-type N-terminal cleavage/methylation domain-containing protein